MNSDSKAIVGTFSLTLGIMLGINYMVSETREDSWLGWIILFLGLAFLFYLWMYRDENRKEDGTQAIDAIRDIEGKIERLQDRAQEKINVAESKIEAVSQATSVATPEPVVEEVIEPEPVVEEVAGPEPVVEEVVEPEPVVEEVSEPEPVVEEISESSDDVEPDDLTKVEGIGPKYRDALHSVGVKTFAQLASLSQEELEAKVKEAGMRRSKSMGTWLEQAKLAAAGDWDALQVLQDELNGGMR